VILPSVTTAVMISTKDALTEVYGWSLAQYKRSDFGEETNNNKSNKFTKKYEVTRTHIAYWIFTYFQLLTA